MGRLPPDVGNVGFHHANDNDDLLGADKCRHRLRHSLVSPQREDAAGGFCPRDSTSEVRPRRDSEGRVRGKKEGSKLRSLSHLMSEATAQIRPPFPSPEAINV